MNDFLGFPEGTQACQEEVLNLKEEILRVFMGEYFWLEAGWEKVLLILGQIIFDLGKKIKGSRYNSVPWGKEWGLVREVTCLQLLSSLSVEWDVEPRCCVSLSAQSSPPPSTPPPPGLILGSWAGLRELVFWLRSPSGLDTTSFLGTQGERPWLARLV